MNLEKIGIKYQFLFYSEGIISRTSDIYIKYFKSNILFPEMIEFLVKSYNMNPFDVYVEKLKTNTWGKFFDDGILELMDGDDFYYQWLNYEIGDIQKLFNLFDNVLNIIIEGPGIGAIVGRKEGITFIINNNEKDRHQFEPHVHCIYSGEEMRVRIDTLEIMKNDKGFKNKRKTKIAIEMIRKNKNQLLNYYNRFAIKGDSNIKFKMEL